MEIIQAAILGVIQGLTEFLPISSSGHLIIIPHLFNWEVFENNLVFDIALHLGTMAALIAFFWADWLSITQSFFKQVMRKKPDLMGHPQSRLGVLLILGSLPAALVGLLFEDFVAETVREPWVVGVMLIVFGLLLHYAEKSTSSRRQAENLTVKDSLIIGLWQAVSLIPGVSRSGSTITGGLLRGLGKETAARFSFLLATPAVAGAALLKSGDLVSVLNDGSLLVFIVGFLASALSGWLVIRFLLAFLKTHDFGIFVKYRLVLGVLVILLTVLFPNKWG